ncbi:dynein heavy chain 1, axonemal-like [Teleopsis dalmanni]|uniref:dynein heavy chain 1, axonemal-like n=1 Tax=Teleopsis dalmanni TaxID=139649 RepID=UPI0018CEFD92|nr:dynein heavy chain 1, axonemal-like [Teleopsis dalmanni]
MSIGFLSTRALNDYGRHRKKCLEPRSILGFCSLHSEIRINKNAVNFVEYNINAGQKWFTLTAEDGNIFTFPLKTTLPKVQLARFVPRKQLPRDVEEDRRRRLYATINLEEELNKVGLGSKDLHPTEVEFYDLDKVEVIHHFPLSFFDNFEYDVHSPEAWLSLGMIGDNQYPLPGKAYLPSKGNPKAYDWQYVAVYSYESATHRWHVIALQSDCEYDVPKCQLMFLAENPAIFAKRLVDAITDRDRGEAVYDLLTMVDSAVHLAVQEETLRFPQKFNKLLLSRHHGRRAYYGLINMEVKQLFEYVMTALEFGNFLNSKPKDFLQYDKNLVKVALPSHHVSMHSIEEYLNMKALNINIKQLRYSVLKTMLTYIPASVEATEGAVVECEFINTMSVFVTHYARPITLHDFLMSQHKNSNNVAIYLKEKWPYRISAILVMIFRANGKGSMDVTLRRWDIFELLKIFKYLIQTKLRMQDTIQSLLERSIIKFTELLVSPCLQFKGMSPDYEWPPNDFINTPFPYEKPVFYVTIGVSRETAKVFYSTLPEEFQPSIMDIFKVALNKTNAIHMVDPDTMRHLHFAPNLYILTVELIEDLYIKCNAQMDEAYGLAIIPLIAYSKLFERFIEFCCLDVGKYMKAYQEADKTSITVKADILEHKRQKEEIRRILPAFITIGPFYINVEQLKTFMVNKHIEIVRKIFEFYVHRMFVINEELQERCRSTFEKIAERPRSIEHLLEIRDFGENIPTVVEGLRSDIQIMWLEYDMLDGFFYCLSDTQFAIKWDTFAWPHKILQRLGYLREEQKLDLEEFKRVHSSECILLEERLESLNDEIQQFSLQFDPNKAVESTVEVKKIWKTISDLEKMGDTLKFRQKLFELEDLSLEFLESIINSFIPYRDLWFGTTDFLKLEEATVGNPLSQVELDEVWKTLEQIRHSLKKSYKIFNEKPELQQVALFYLDKIKEFKPVYDCISWLKNENWLLLHWLELSQLTGVDIKYNPNLNFQTCIRKGILEVLDVVKSISDRAQVDAEELRRQQEEEERLKEEARLAIEMRKALRKCRRDIM